MLGKINVHVVLQVWTHPGEIKPSIWTNQAQHLDEQKGITDVVPSSFDRKSRIIRQVTL